MHPAQIKIGSEKYPVLTGMRAVSAIMVFVIHIAHGHSFLYGLNVISLFFVLSGFLIFYLYYPTLQLSRSWMARYFTNRFARIYPVYFLVITGVILLQGNYETAFLIKTYTLTHALFDDLKDLALKPSWSLTVEESFYVLAPILMLLVRKFSLWAAMVFCGGLLIAALYISLLHLPFSPPPLRVSMSFLGHSMEFLSGIVLATVVMRLDGKNYQPRGCKWTVTGIVGLVIIVAILAHISKLPGEMKETAVISRIFVNNFLTGPPIALLYFGLIYERTWLSKILSGALFGWLGRTSYSFYVLHMPVIDFIAVPLLLPLLKDHAVVYAFITYGIVAIASLLIYLYYEEPLNRSLRRKLLAAEQTPSPAAVKSI